METLSALLALCEGNPPVTGGFPRQKAGNAGFKPPSCWRIQTPGRSLWRHCKAHARIGIPNFHDDVIKWEHFPRYLPFVQGIHRSPVNSPHKGQWRGPLMLCLICAWIDGWVNNGEAGDLRRHGAHNDVIVMLNWPCPQVSSPELYHSVVCNVDFRQSTPPYLVTRTTLPLFCPNVLCCYTYQIMVTITTRPQSNPQPNHAFRIYVCLLKISTIQCIPKKQLEYFNHQIRVTTTTEPYLHDTFFCFEISINSLMLSDVMWC